MSARCFLLILGLPFRSRSTSWQAAQQQAAAQQAAQAAAFQQAAYQQVMAVIVCEEAFVF